MPGSPVLLRPRVSARRLFMKVGILVKAVAVLLGSVGFATAGTVNCKQVNKYLQTGRSVQDVAETMVIDAKEVKKCQDEAAAAPGATGGEQKGGEQKGGEQKGGEAGQGMQK
jgi:hypothetical protein